MKAIIGIAAIVMFMTVGAAAQSGGAVASTTFKPLPSTVMGRTVKGAPYAADEITESAQVLGDGTHINHQSQVTMYRDSEGRVRRETPGEITIWDPVDNVSYRLDPKTMKAYKTPMLRATYKVNGTMGAAASTAGTNLMFFTFSGPDGAEHPALKAAGEAQVADLKAKVEKMTAEMNAAAGSNVVVDGNPASTAAAAAAKEKLALVMQKLATRAANVKTEDLGKQVFEGVEAEGTRITTTIETGEIGNDRPILEVSERWYSPELQTMVMTKHSDPRTGEETFRLENVRRGDPGADLFMVPPGYQLVEPAAVKIPLPKLEQ
ncbi:MAG TPA: hypothetical protein VLY04_25445 [Bryobacteraceae bacterium]|nr:hypothetical protein [Bryobacteraceae bacterium]